MTERNLRKQPQLMIVGFPMLSNNPEIKRKPRLS
jgi:hypothetical protein